MTRTQRHTVFFCFGRFPASGLARLLCALLLLPAAAPAQETMTEPKTFDRPYWRETIEGLDYRSGSGATPPQTEMRQRQAEEEADRQAAEQEGRSWNFRLPGLGLAGKIILILIAAVLLFFLLRGLLGIQWSPRNKRVRPGSDPGVELDKIEEDIEAFDLEDYIRRALDSGAYATAVRLQYLAVLKELSAQQLIRWKKDKTNNDYLQELRGTPPAAEFQRLTRADYEALEPQFRDFRQGLTTGQTAASDNL